MCICNEVLVLASVTIDVRFSVWQVIGHIQYIRSSSTQASRYVRHSVMLQ
jgi:hypothetical protein